MKDVMRFRKRERLAPEFYNSLSSENRGLTEIIMKTDTGSRLRLNYQCENNFDWMCFFLETEDVNTAMAKAFYTAEGVAYGACSVGCMEKLKDPYSNSWMICSSPVKKCE
ncbi:hypothetical protein CQW23_19530 [Capsicum baccatum]|uniref:Uncharacterized protein n=1 Tax=Capsicum baccatum TaxID=33114 RepID=A0A2G2W626_CAPBA|nr:hypothetical protein CQW23_19530 [Capsicum baccatum]